MLEAVDMSQSSAVLTINGTLYRFDKLPVSIAELLAGLNENTTSIAVACNSQLIPRSAFNTTPLHPGDQIEIVRAVQGG